MTEEIKTILALDVQGAENVRELRDNIKLLKDALNDENATADENKAVLDALRENQNALKDAMHQSAQSTEDLIAKADNLDVSYNELVHTLADLKARWRETTDETERADLGAAVNKVNDKLKALDAGVGSYKRNVGNYANSVLDAFSQMGGSATGMVAGIKNLNGAMTLLSTNPVMAVLGLLATVLQKIIASLKSSEENMNAVTRAFSAFNVVGDVLNKLLQGLGSAIAWLAEKFVGLLDSLNLVTDAMEERQAIAQKEIELAAKEREAIAKNAEIERDVAKLKAEAAEKDKLTTEQRLAKLQEAADKEKEIAKTAYENAKLAFEIQAQTNALTESSAEDKKKEAEAYAAMVKAETDYYNKIKEVAGQISEARTSMLKEQRDAAKAAQDAKTTQLNSEKELIQQEIELTQKGTAEMLALQEAKRTKEYEIAVLNAKTKIRNAEDFSKTLANLEAKYNKDILALQRSHQKEVENQANLHLQNLANAYGQGSADYLVAMKDLRKQQLDQITAAGQEQGETEEEYIARRLAAQQAYNEAVRSLNAKRAEDSTAELRLAVSRELGETQGYYEAMLLLAQDSADNLRKLEGESDTEYLIRKQEADNAVKAAEEDLLNYMDEAERLKWENRMNAQQEGSVEYLAAAVDLKRYELDTLSQMDSESDDEFFSRKLAKEKEYINAKKALTQQQITLAQTAASGISSTLNSLAAIYENDTNASEAELRKAKNLKIASATIDMLSGVVSAVSGAMDLGPILGPIYAAINSASVIAAGTANIASIRKQSTSSSGSSSSAAATGMSASVSAPDVTTQIQEVRNITSASEEEKLNTSGDQRVVLVMSDIEVKENEKRVQVAETSF